MKNHAPSLNTASLSELQTIRDWLRFFVSEMTRSGVFFGHGSANALDEAVYLVQSALHLPMGDVSPFLDARVVQTEREKLYQFLIDRTAKRRPASYITGESWLQGQRFQVDERVIIPRSFIAELLSDQLTPWVNAPEAELRVLDLCTGSGCLGILAAYAFENAEVDCVDLSEQALELARSNIEQHQLQDRVEAIHSDLFNNLQGKRYDIILTNPPYVNEHSMGQLPPEYLHEPRMALAGGEDGMDLIRRIVADAPRYLNEGGLLIIELGNERNYFEEAFPELEPVWLDVSAGDEQVLLLNKDDLKAHS